MKPVLARYRLGSQRLVGDALGSPIEVVGHLGAVQAQLPEMALWAIGRRCGATLTAVETAFAEGDFVRTHVLRPTWHYVLRDDLADLLAATAPRIRQLMASNNRRDGLERADIERWARLAIDVIRQDGPLTRAEVEARLADAGFVRAGNSMAHVMAEAELTGEIHSGPIQGKQHTYQSANLPPSRRTPDDRLAWLAQTYGRGHGPFRAKDLAWWTSLTLTQARRAIALADLDEVELAGERHHLVEPLEAVDVPPAMLLPCFDEYISYTRDPDDYALVDGQVGMVLRSSGLLFIHGALGGTWSRSMTAAQVIVEVKSTSPLNDVTRGAIEDEAERFGAFANRPVTCVTHALG